MNLKIKQALEQQSKKVRKHVGIQPYLYAYGGMVLLIALYMGFTLINASGNLLVNILGIILVVAFILVGLPLLYGVSVLTSNATRFNKLKELNIKTCFDKYYHGNPGFFSIGGIIFKGILISFASFFVVTLLIYQVGKIFYNDFFIKLVDVVAHGTFDSMDEFATLMGEYWRLFEVFYISVFSFSAIPLFIFVGSELRKNESVYYAANELVSDNYIDVATRPLIPLFRRGILPLVKREHRAYNFRLNYLGYVIFYVLYLGIVILCMFLPQVPFSYVSFIAFGVAIIFYAPFYYRQRVFDALFYIAYADKIMDRANSNIKQIIEAGRQQIMSQVQKYKEKNPNANYEEKSDDDNDDNHSDNSSSDNSMPQKGEYDAEHDEVDFTKHKDSDDNDEE